MFLLTGWVLLIGAKEEIWFKCPLILHNRCVQNLVENSNVDLLNESNIDTEINEEVGGAVKFGYLPGKDR